MLAGAVGLVVASAIWAVVGHDKGGGDPRDDSMSVVRERTDGEVARTAQEEGQAQRAFARASRRLETAHSYAYSGTVHALAASDARPAQAPASDVSVEGEVRWPLWTHDVAVAASGEAAETTTVGPTIWQRRAPTEGDLTATRFVFAGDVHTWSGPQVPFGAGAARLPSWLAATTDRQPDSEQSGASGHRTFQATLPADRLGEIDRHPPSADGLVTLTVDADGNPSRIEVEAGTAWRLAVDITAIGDPVTIDLPNGELPGATDGPSPADVHAAGISAPVELARLPRGWMLAAISLVRDDQTGCATLELDYAAIDAKAVSMKLEVTAPRCSEPADPTTSLSAGAFRGGARLSGAGAGGALSDGRTALQYTSSLSQDDALRLIETVEPYDPSTRPTAADELPPQ